MKNILLPTDFSKNSWKALEYALHLFENEACNFYLLNAFQAVYFTTDSLMVPEPGEPAYDMAHQSSMDGLEKLVDGLSEIQENPNHHFKIVSSYNTVAEAVVNAVEKYSIQLIVMGTKGSGDPENRIFGSNAVHVTDIVENCPIIIIPANAEFISDIKKEVVLATNFKSSYSLPAINYLAEVTKRFNASLRVLNIQQEENLSEFQENNKESLQELLKDVPHSFHTLTNISVAKGIISFLESRGSHLLILNHKKPGFFKQFFNKPLLKSLNKKPNIPILILPAKEYFPQLF